VLADAHARWRPRGLVLSAAFSAQPGFRGRRASFFGTTDAAVPRRPDRGWEACGVGSRHSERGLWPSRGIYGWGRSCAL